MSILLRRKNKGILCQVTYVISLYVKDIIVLRCVYHLGDCSSHTSKHENRSICSKGFVEVFSINPVCAKASADPSTVQRSN